MQNDRETLENYLVDVSRLLKEMAKEARDAKVGANGTENYDYEIGHLMAMHEVISLLQQEARAFGIDLKILGLDDIDPERDLL